MQQSLSNEHRLYVINEIEEILSVDDAEDYEESAYDELNDARIENYDQQYMFDYEDNKNLEEPVEEDKDEHRPSKLSFNESNLSLSSYYNDVQEIHVEESQINLEMQKEMWIREETAEVNQISLSLLTSSV